MRPGTAEGGRLRRLPSTASLPVREGSIRYSGRAASVRLTEVRSPDVMVRLRKSGTQSLAPRNVVGRVNHAVQVVIACDCTDCRASPQLVAKRVHENRFVELVGRGWADTLRAIKTCPPKVESRRPGLLLVRCWREIG